MQKTTSLNELFKGFSETMTNTPIKYLIRSYINSPNIFIFDLTKMVAKCQYDFDLNNVSDKNKFEYDNVRFYPKLVFGEESCSLDTSMTYKELIRILKLHFSKNGNSDVIYYASHNPAIIKKRYEFIHYRTNIQEMIYSPGSYLIVDGCEDFEMFSNLEIEDDLPYISGSILDKRISLDEYKILSYCINSIKVYDPIINLMG